MDPASSTATPSWASGINSTGAEEPEGDVDVTSPAHRCKGGSRCPIINSVTTSSASVGLDTAALHQE
jgi:hypothetical protein